MNKKIRTGCISLANTLLPVLFSLAVGAIFLVLSGNNPLLVYFNIIKWSFFTADGIAHTIAFASPIAITGLAIAISYRGGTFNLGVEGQLYIGALVATYLGFSITTLPRWLHLIVCITGGATAGMALGLIPALMKAYYKVSEIVTTMMLNNAIIIFCSYLTNGPFNANIGYTATFEIEPTAKLTRLYGTTRLSSAVFIALALFILTYVIIKKSKLGFEIEAMGRQKEFSDAMGMKFYVKTIILFLISGAFAGIAGATEIMGSFYRFTPSFSTNPGIGWQGIQVANLAGRDPVGVMIASLFYGAFKYGGTALQTRMGISADLINIIQSSLILFIGVKYLKNETAFFEILKPKMDKVKSIRGSASSTINRLKQKREKERNLSRGASL